VQKQTRIPELDGLRGLAILLVIFYHYTNGEALTRANGLAYYVERIASQGWTGVNLFFVLSGFLIGGILIDARASDTYFRTFYVRRFFRIIPIYYLWICLYIALVSAAGTAVRARSFSGKELPHGFEVYAHFLFLQNVIPHDWAARPGLWGSWVSHLWSLAVEEQFYLLAPLMIFWLSPRQMKIVLWGIVCGVPFVRVALLFHVHRIEVMHVMPAYADALALGILTAIVWREPASRLWLGRNLRFLYGTTALFFAGFGVLWWYDPGLGGFGVASVGLTWIAIFYALLVLIVLAGSNGWIARAMRLQWLRNLGRVSYCMYIIHLIVNLFCHTILLHTRPRIDTLAGAGVSILAAIVTYGLAVVSWKILEGPLVRIGHGFVYSLPASSQARAGNA
jgi:peptidoglycan/LPS O-acetylase OafA/YrhL